MLSSLSSPAHIYDSNILYGPLIRFVMVKIAVLEIKVCEPKHPSVPDTICPWWVAWHFGTNQQTLVERSWTGCQHAPKQSY